MRADFSSWGFGFFVLLLFLLLLLLLLLLRPGVDLAFLAGGGGETSSISAIICGESHEVVSKDRHQSCQWQWRLLHVLQAASSASIKIGKGAVIVRCCEHGPEDVLVVRVVKVVCLAGSFLFTSQFIGWETSS